MFRPLLALLLTLITAAAAPAFETPARIHRIDADRRLAQVFAGGQDRTVRIAAEVRVLDEAGKDLRGGLRAPQLKEGAKKSLCGS